MFEHPTGVPTCLVQSPSTRLTSQIMATCGAIGDVTVREPTMQARTVKHVTAARRPVRRRCDDIEADWTSLGIILRVDCRVWRRHQVVKPTGERVVSGDQVARHDAHGQYDLSNEPIHDHSLRQQHLRKPSVGCWVFGAGCNGRFIDRFKSLFGSRRPCIQSQQQWVPLSMRRMSRFTGSVYRTGVCHSSPFLGQSPFRTF